MAAERVEGTNLVVCVKPFIASVACASDSAPKQLGILNEYPPFRHVIAYDVAVLEWLPCVPMSI